MKYKRHIITETVCDRVQELCESRGGRPGLSVLIIIIIIIKRVSRAPIYHRKWQHRALYNNY